MDDESIEDGEAATPSAETPEVVDSTDRKPPSWRAVWLAIGAVVVVVILAMVLTRGNDDDQNKVAAQAFLDSVEESGGGPVKVVYELDGTALSADITIETPDGTSQQTADVPMMNKAGDEGLHFNRGFYGGDFVYISAQNNGTTGTLTCRIRVDGRVISENTASGRYSIATCKGSA